MWSDLATWKRFIHNNKPLVFGFDGQGVSVSMVIMDMEDDRPRCPACLQRRCLRGERRAAYVVPPPPKSTDLYVVATTLLLQLGCLLEESLNSWRIQTRSVPRGRTQPVDAVQSVFVCFVWVSWSVPWNALSSAFCKSSHLEHSEGLTQLPACQWQRLQFLWAHHREWFVWMPLVSGSTVSQIVFMCVS